MSETQSMQEALVHALLSDDSNRDVCFDQKGLEAYRRGLFANARRALEVTFPTILQLIGFSRFEACTTSYLQASPPAISDWGLWGNNFPEHLAQQPALAELPYLTDCAKLDWYCHLAERCADQTLDPNTLTLLEGEPYSLTLVPGVGLTTLESDYPIVEIYRAHHDAEHLRERQLAIAKDKLTRKVGETALIWRREWKAQVIALSPAEQYWMTLMVRQASLGSALDTMQASGYDFSFVDWLPKAIEHKWIVGIAQAPLKARL